MKKKYIFLFDIDGTLLWSGGAGVQALDHAFREAVDIEGGMDGVVCDGKTDPAIVSEVLSPRGLADHEHVQKVLDSYVRMLPKTVADAEGYRVLPGVTETLEYLRRRGDVLCGLATGNVRSGAIAKLERAGLNQYFQIGGFGSDSEERAELVRVALRRAHRCLGEDGAAAVVIGDTPLDMAAARAAGALPVGVATGHFDSAQLKNAGAVMVLIDLSSPTRWVPRLLRFMD